MTCLSYYFKNTRSMLDMINTTLLNIGKTEIFHYLS